MGRIVLPLSLTVSVYHEADTPLVCAHTHLLQHIFCGDLISTGLSLTVYAFSWVLVPHERAYSEFRVLNAVI